MKNKKTEKGKGAGTPGRRILRVLFALSILLVGVEGVLQAGAVLAGRRNADNLADPGAPAILCLGDSHTYGAGVGPDETYPYQLERMIRQRGRRVNVVNLGAPGVNTSQIRRGLESNLEAYKPAAVIVLAGVNNGWNRRDQSWSDAADGLEVGPGKRAADFLTTRVKLIKAASVLAHRLDWTAPPEETARDRSGRTVIHKREESWDLEPAEATYSRAKRDLVAIVALCRAHHAEPVLMTYVTEPDYPFATPNRLLREVASEMKTALGDNDAALGRDFKDAQGKVDLEARNRLFLPDMHPKGPGYERIARNLIETLEKAGVIERLPAK